MDWFNWYGTVIVAFLMVPNLFFLMKQKEQSHKAYRNLKLEIPEQIGRIGCIIFMMLQIPYACRGVWLANGWIVYCVGNGILLAAYVAFWILCWNRYPRFRALSLSILPSVLFLWSGILTANLPLLATVLLFAPTHIAINWKTVSDAK